MYLLKILLFFFFAIWHVALRANSNTITVEKPSLTYTVSYPDSWDTVPADTIMSRQLASPTDVVVYHLSNESYFNGEYIGYVFLPTMKALTGIEFAVLANDFSKSISQIRNDSITIDSFRTDDEKQLFQVWGKTTLPSKTKIFKQLIIPTKFGFLKVLYNQSDIGQTSNRSLNRDLLSTVNISEKYKYIPPADKSNLGIRHIIGAFLISIVVYLLILYGGKIKKHLGK